MALTAEKSPITFWGANNHVFLSNLAVSKRRTQNTRSGTRVPNAGGVYSGFWRPEASQSYFCSLQKGSVVSHRVFHNFQILLGPLLIALQKNVRGQNLFLSEKKRIREGQASTFFASPKKGSGVGKINFLVTSSTILSP